MNSAFILREIDRRMRLRGSVIRTGQQEAARDTVKARDEILGDLQRKPLVSLKGRGDSGNEFRPRTLHVKP